MENRLLEIVNVAMSRRAVFKAAVGTAATLAVFHNVTFAETQALAADLKDDIDILNFALTLEHLESRAYRDAIASGRLSGPALAAAQQYGRQEAEHVTLLTGAINAAGRTPVAEQQSYKFPAFTSQATIITFLRVLEETGVGAYTGAARFIADKTVLAAAGGIVQVEARHATALRALDGMAPVPGALDIVLTPDQTLAAAGPILAS